MLRFRNYAGTPCPYCGAPLVPSKFTRPRSPTNDHIAPKWAYGTRTIVCCWQCNNDKAGLFLTEWIAELVAHNDPRVFFVRKVAANYPYLAVPNEMQRPSGATDDRMTDAQRLLAELRG